MRYVAPVPRTVSRGLRTSFAPMAKCAAQFVNGSRFEFQCSALITRVAQLAKCAAHLVKRCTFGQMQRILPIGQMRSAFGQLRRLVKCALHPHGELLSGCDTTQNK